MNKTPIQMFIASTLLAMVGIHGSQAQETDNAQHHHYRLIDLGIAMALFCAAVAIPVPSIAQHNTDHRQPRYKLVDLGTLGGVTSYINPVGNGGPYLNGKGMVVGSSMTSIPIPPNQNGYPCPSPPDEVFHAMQWGLSGVTELQSVGRLDSVLTAAMRWPSMIAGKPLVLPRTAS
jgi:hypothetical protein